MPRARLREDLENMFVVAETRNRMVGGFLQVCNQHGRHCTFISTRSVIFSAADLSSDRISFSGCLQAVIRTAVCG
jgi:hypothetical protein